MAAAAAVAGLINVWTISDSHQATGDPPSVSNLVRFRVDSLTRLCRITREPFPPSNGGGQETF